MAPLRDALSWALSFLSLQSVLNEFNAEKCDTAQHGYRCSPSISQYWGEYSPYYSVPGAIPPDLPAGCHYTFANMLSRHGARDPTARRSVDYKSMIEQLKSNVNELSGIYAFLADYEYTLGSDNLTDFGRQELVNSGMKFFDRYSDLASHHSPFVRSSGLYRVIDSANHWIQGYQSAKAAQTERVKSMHELRISDDTCVQGMVIIPEGTSSNNTLCHGPCTAFTSPNKTYHKTADRAQKHFAQTFVGPIMDRLNNDMLGANLDANQTIALMDLCPFMTVEDPLGTVSPFCALFTEQEWHSYNYYESLSKFYGYGPGNGLGPTQGVGYAAELLARLTGDSSYVTNEQSYTSINHTLDTDSCTFPLGKTPLFADFSHDNDITGIMSALGLFDFMSELLPWDHLVEPEVNGYAASWTVPFSGRVYFEKMMCEGADEELVRVVANDRVMTLSGCDADELGRCTLSAFVDSRTFAKSGGRWNELCFS